MSHTLSQIKSFPVGTVIPKVEGTIKKVFPAKSDVGQYGPWKLQGFILSDSGEEIRCTLFDGEDIQFLEGKRVSIISTGTNGRTKKQQGVSIESSKKDGSLELVIKNKNGGAVLGDQPNPAYMKGTPENAASSAAPLRSEPVSRPTPIQDNGDGAIDALNRLACFWLACWHKASLVDGLPPETKQSMASCLFIEGNKQGLARLWLVEEALKAKPPVQLTKEEDQSNPF
jgi:hypothetical protein